MNWDNVVLQCLVLSEQTGVELPETLTKGPKGRFAADVWLRQAVMIDTLAGFLGDVGKQLTQENEKKAQKAKAKQRG